MKRFFSENLSGMTFTFSFIIMLNAVLGLFQGVTEWNNPSKFILGLAFLILVFWTVSYGVSYLDFRSVRAFHFFNFSIQLIAFFTVGSLLGLLPLTLDSIVSNGMVAAIVYYMNNRLRKHQMSQLANAINRHLSQGGKQ